MKLASHNSLSSYRPKRWWMALINPLAECQNKRLAEQFNAGVRMFDIRVRPFSAEAAHGLVTYDVDIPYVLTWFNDRAAALPQHTIYIRLCCENFAWQDEDDVIEWFTCFFRKCQIDYPNLNFCGGYIKTGWTKVIDCKDPEYRELYRTFNHHVGLKGWDKVKSIIDYITHPLPKYWAKKDNKGYIEENKDYESYIMLDYV